MKSAHTVALTTIAMVGVAEVIVTGVQTGINETTGAAPARLNIIDLYEESGPAWDLYVQALAALQKVDESDDLSYFGIMGIHGLPFTNYSGVGQVPGGNEVSGFCPHGGLLFGLWHRPYIALFEQVLVSHAVSIAKLYTGDEATMYQAAAETLRAAYWDWASNATLPEVVTVTNVKVNGPHGSLTLTNPFHRYHFQNYPFAIEYMDSGVLSLQGHTTRCPNAKLVDNVAEVDLGLSEYGSLQDQVYDVFTTVQEFQDMETYYYNQPSFESPHDIVHDVVGCGNGTMLDLNWAAFDPIFMLHHANVDRLIALWQHIYPNASIFDVVGYEGAIYGTPAGNVSAESPLKPFYQSSGNFFTSNTAQNISTFGYTYPELQPPRSDGTTTQEELSAYVKSQVNSLYSDSSVGSHTTKFRPRQGGSIGAHLRRGGTHTMWSVEITVDKAKVPLPATVCVSLDGQTAGKMAILAIPNTGVARSTINLNRVLEAANLTLTSRSVHSVRNYLSRYLQVELQNVGNGTFFSLDLDGSLQVTLLSRDVRQRKSDYEFPTYGPVTTYSWP